MIVLGTVEYDGAAFESVRIRRVRQITLPEFVRDDARLHYRGIEQVAREDLESGLLFQRLLVGTDDVAVRRRRVLQIRTNGLAVDRDRFDVEAAGTEQLTHYRRQSAGAIIFLAEIRTRRLHVDEQRHIMTDCFPVRHRKRNAGMTGNRVDVDRRVGRAADRRAGDDGVLERLAGKDIARLEVLMHDLDRAAAGFVGNLDAFAIRRRNGGAAR